MRRRAFLAASAALLGLGGLALSPLSPLPWRLLAGLPGRPGWLAAELSRTLAALLGAAPVAPGSLPSELTPEVAAAALVAGLSRREVGSLLASPERLRAHLERRRRSDLAADRTRIVHGWLLAETELLAAAVLAGDAGP